MPCLTSERYQNMEGVEKLARSMCSTPLRPNGVCESALEYADVSAISANDDGDALEDYAQPLPTTFEECYLSVLLELEKLNSIKLKRELYVKRSSDLIRNDDRMLDKWENLECQTDETEKKCTLQRNIYDLRNKLLDVCTRMPNMTYHIEDRMQLEKNLQIVKGEFDWLVNQKSLISDYNVKAHRLLNDSKHSTPSLKDDINELYRIWNETDQKVSHQLNTLQLALQAWRNFDMHMLELKTVLREAHTALNVLDQASKQKQDVGDVTSTFQNIVKYLPDKHHNLMKVNNNRVTVLDSTHIDTMSNLFMNTLNVEGSFSDSGISDSGSEQDQCGREKRLADLRKFTRNLEAVLAPGSEALLNFMKKIDEAEEEIRELQQTYRTIIKTGYLEKSDRESLKKDNALTDNFQTETQSDRRTSPGDPGSDPDKGRSVFWRVLRAALPFHLAIVVLLCVACLLEPNCCDAINNLNLSLSPQLRYLSGPPPT